MIARARRILAACQHCGIVLAASIICSLFITSVAWAEDKTKGIETLGENDKYAVHDYFVRFRPTVWMVNIEGKYQTRLASGRKVSVKFDRDLDYDEPYRTFRGEASVRRGRHDFWITGTAFDQSESAPINVEFTIDDDVFNLGGVVDTEVSITDINFRYGYSFFEFEEDGFRLGPTFAVSYTDVSMKLTELTIAGTPTGARFNFEETLPVPTVGIHAEVPYHDFLFSAQFGSFYAEFNNFKAAGIRAQAGITWRLYDNVGFFAGFNSAYIDLDLKNEQVDDVLLWGPAFGLEFRF